LKDFDKIILGIDPGTNILGYGLIGINGKQMTLISTGVVRMTKLENHQLKLKKIFESITHLIEEYFPDEVAVEAPFFGKNVQSMLKLGRALGVAMAATLVKDLPIEEYSPRKIKQSITGNGASSKEQVAKMIQNILKLKSLPKELDATDGIAAAICHFFQNNIDKSKDYSGWNDFLKNNPKRSNQSR
jgi:crossover junction endodeoxyribonuclease RuvC